MKEIVWVFGNSASGKETFIRTITDTDNLHLLPQFSWEQKTLKACDSSLKYIGQFHDDPITIKRDEILTEAPLLLLTADVVLIKWQMVDSEGLRIEKLMEELPNAHHRIILLSTSHAELTNRLPVKRWWRNENVDTFVQNENLQVKNWLDELNGKLPIVKISGNPHDDYRII